MALLLLLGRGAALGNQPRGGVYIIVMGTDRRGRGRGGVWRGREGQSRGAAAAGKE